MTETLICPYHPKESDHKPVFGVGDEGGLTGMSCGFPATACPKGHANRVVARFCRICKESVLPRDTAALNATLLTLWNSVPGDGSVESIRISLSGAGAVTAFAHGFGYLFVGTRRGKLLVFNAWHLVEPIAVLSAGETILGLNVFDGPPQPIFPGPCVVVSTTSGVFRLSPWPEFDLERLWSTRTGWRVAAPSVPLSRGMVLFQRQGEEIEVAWREWQGAEDSERPFPEWIGPELGPPVNAGPGRVFFTDGRRAFLLDDADPEHLHAIQLPVRPDTVVFPSYSPELQEVFLVYEEERRRGVGRVSIPALEWLRVVDPAYAALQLAAIDEKALILSSHDDLEIVSPVGGTRTWSLKLRFHVDQLSLSLFAPVRAGGFLVLYAEARQGKQSLYLLPLNNTGIREGPRRVADTGRLEMPPVATPAGLVCVPQMTNGSTELLVVQPRAR